MRNRKIASRLSQAVDWSDGGPGVKITAISNRRVLVENHRGIIEFSDTGVKLRTRKGAVSVNGSNISIKDLRPDVLVVSGKIDSIYLGGDVDD